MNHQDDSPVDSYISWPYAPSDREPRPLMTIFGFGRPAWDDPRQHTPPLTRLPAKFSIAFTRAEAAPALATLAAEIRR